ncbi:MAG: lipoprotein insertase outer membrane protein LolB [Methylotenera sp.]|nr:lipoprotein insertase outer membrane protein LolB [Methylotenera sp.]
MRLIFVLSIIAAIQGCVSVPKPVTSTNAASLRLHEQHQEALKTIVQFTLKGRIGVQADGKGFSGSLDWQHNKANDEIALYSPLGGQVASIKKTLDKVTLEDAKGNNISAADTETLTQKALGWQLPLSGLADWSLGRPTNSAIQASTWDEQGYLSSLKQDGWEIEYQNYANQNGHVLPSKIVLRRDKVNLKLLIENWADIAN